MSKVKFQVDEREQKMYKKITEEFIKLIIFLIHYLAILWSWHASMSWIKQQGKDEDEENPHIALGT